MYNSLNYRVSVWKCEQVYSVNFGKFGGFSSPVKNVETQGSNESVMIHSSQVWCETINNTFKNVFTPLQNSRKYSLQIIVWRI